MRDQAAELNVPPTFRGYYWIPLRSEVLLITWKGVFPVASLRTLDLAQHNIEFVNDG